jgi:hypothetical protein
MCKAMLAAVKNELEVFAAIDPHTWCLTVKRLKTCDIIAQTPEHSSLVFAASA